MNKYIYMIFTVALCSCGTPSIITVKNPDVSEKEYLLSENNTNFSTVGIVGSGFKLAQEEAQKLIKKKNDERGRKLSNIREISVSKFKDDFGQEQYKATINNSLLFRFDSYELSDSTTNVLTKIIPIIKDMPTRLLIVGHTDSVGEDEYNLVLSRNRANSVAQFLIQNGIDPQDIEQEGKGESFPIATNATKEGQAKNRRVEIFMYKKRNYNE